MPNLACGNLPSPVCIVYVCECVLASSLGSLSSYTQKNEGAWYSMVKFITCVT